VRTLVFLSFPILLFLSCNGKKPLNEKISSAIVFDTIADRPLQIYLPPGHNLESSYPVIFFNDGQNLFIDSTSFAGEWHIDEILDSLIANDQIEPLIVVGIYNSPFRAEEYLPYFDPRLLEWLNLEKWDSAKVDSYSDLVLNKIKPQIESQYSASSNRENVAILGSSLGAINAFWIGVENREQFGFVGAISPSTWVANGAVIDDLRSKDLAGLKIWIDQGSEEYDEKTLKLAHVLNNKEYVRYGENLWYYEVKNAKHNEYWWSKRIMYPLLLFKGKKDEVESIELELFSWKNPDQEKSNRLQRFNLIANTKNKIKFNWIDNFEFQNNPAVSRQGMIQDLDQLTDSIDVKIGDSIQTYKIPD
jgi:predicted alpha/beta superfamily hydrolase